MADGLIAQLVEHCTTYVFFTFLGYITNSQSGQLPDGLIAQLVEHWTGITAKGHGFESCSDLNFFDALISQLLTKLCA